MCSSSLPSVPVAARSAFRSGGLVSVIVRSSRHARSGFVLVAVFGSLPAAGRFASLWARRLGLPMFIRRSCADFAVSVPVAPVPDSFAQGGFSLSAVGLSAPAFFWAVEVSASVLYCL